LGVAGKSAVFAVGAEGRVTVAEARFSKRENAR
jgi:hypothetical protein